MEDIFTNINNIFKEERKAIDKEKELLWNSTLSLGSVKIGVETTEKLYKKYLEITFLYINVLNNTTEAQIRKEGYRIINDEWDKLKKKIGNVRKGRIFSCEIDPQLVEKLYENFNDVLEAKKSEKKLTIKQPTTNSQNVLPAKVDSNFAKNKDIFLAHIFVETNLIEPLKNVITKMGYNWKEGKREDLGSISQDILSKIKNCGFFLVVMTKRDELKEGDCTTSSWLIEEKGAALAYGHEPLIMVEEGVDRHYVGFLQNDAQMIYFNRPNFNSKSEEAICMIDKTYKRNNSEM